MAFGGKSRSSRYIRRLNHREDIVCGLVSNLGDLKTEALAPTR